MTIELKEHFVKNNQSNILSKTSKYWVYYNNYRCLDTLSGNAAFSLGYGNSIIKEAMANSEIDYIRDSDTDISEDSQRLAQYLCNFGFSKVYWTASGTDAIECAVYMVDQYWKTLGENKTKVISFTPGYHGASMLARHLRGQNKELGKSIVLSAPEWSVIDQREFSEHIVLEQLKTTLENCKTSIGAIIMETCPWIKVNPYSQNWYTVIRQLCDQYKILLVIDDIAFFGGKAPTMLGSDVYNIKPDIVAIGKSLTGGYSPLAATMCNKKISDVITQSTWQYGHTYSPNIVGVRAALAAIPQIENLLKNVPTITKKFENLANEFDFCGRGMGTIFCLDTPKEFSDRELYNAGLIGKSSGDSLVFCAPLIADDEYFNTLSNALKSLLK